MKKNKLQVGTLVKLRNYSNQIIAESSLLDIEEVEYLKTRVGKIASLDSIDKDCDDALIKNWIQVNFSKSGLLYINRNHLQQAEDKFSRAWKSAMLIDEIMSAQPMQGPVTKEELKWSNLKFVDKFNENKKPCDIDELYKNHCADVYEQPNFVDGCCVNPKTAVKDSGNTMKELKQQSKDCDNFDLEITNLLKELSETYYGLTPNTKQKRYNSDLLIKFESDVPTSELVKVEHRGEVEKAIKLALDEFYTNAAKKA